MTDETRAYHFGQLKQLADLLGDKIYIAFHNSWSGKAEIAKGEYKGNTYIFYLVKRKDNTIDYRIDRILIEEDKSDYKVWISSNSNFLYKIKWKALSPNHPYESLDEFMEKAKRKCEYDISELQQTLSLLNYKFKNEED